tara:strand:- start:4086 stop:4271 length:186 start_codon:yes stop_codon:yes gene_type:complete
MQFQRNTSIDKSRSITKILIKVFLVFVLFGICIVLVDKIEFPSPYKKIEKIVPNENLKIIK